MIKVTRCEAGGSRLATTEPDRILTRSCPVLSLSLSLGFQSGSVVQCQSQFSFRVSSEPESNVQLIQSDGGIDCD